MRWRLWQWRQRRQRYGALVLLLLLLVQKEERVDRSTGGRQQTETGKNRNRKQPSREAVDSSFKLQAEVAPWRLRAMAGIPRRRGGSAVLFGLPGQEGLGGNTTLERSISFKLAPVEEGQEPPPRRSLAFADEGSGGGSGAAQTPRSALKKPPQPTSVLKPSPRPPASPPLAGSARTPRSLLKRGRARAQPVSAFQLRASAETLAEPVPQGPQSAPTSASGRARIEWGDGAVVYEGEAMTYMSNRYPNGQGGLRWKEERWGCWVEFTPAAPGWKFGSCEGHGTLRFENGHVYEGQVSGPGAPSPQIFVNDVRGPRP